MSNLDCKTYIFDRTKTINQIIVVNMLQNLSHMYSSHYMIIKCVGFKSIHYTINLNIMLSFEVFNKFYSVFLLNVLLALINKIISFQKNNNNISNW